MEKIYPGVEYEILEKPSADYVLINDLTLTGCNVKEELARIIEISKGKISSYASKDLVTAMGKRLEKALQTYSAEEVLLIFPGNGGIVTYNALPEELRTYFYNALYVDVHRKMLKSGNREAIMPDDDIVLLNEYLAGNPHFQKICVVDDAVTTGGTVNKIKSSVTNSHNYDWSVASQVFFPLSASNPQALTQSVNNIHKIITGLVLDGKKSPFPSAFLSSALDWGIQTDPNIRTILNNIQNNEEKNEFIEVLHAMQQTYDGFHESQSIM